MSKVSFTFMWHLLKIIVIICSVTREDNALTMLPATGRQHRGGCITPQAVTHSLVLLKMGKIIA